MDISNFKGEWLDFIPNDWSQKKIKHLFNIKKNIARKLGYEVISITQKGAKVKNIESGGGQLSMDYSKYQLVDKGDFLMNHMDLLTGFIDISNFDGVTSPDYRVFYLEDKNLFPQFFLYLFQHCYTSKIFYGYGRGSSKLGRWRLPSVEFENFYLPIPSSNEQKLISQYLGRKTRQVDSLIEKIKKKIEFIEEQKTALINQYVTKGLDPNIDWKDSGINGVGKIPENWLVSKLKYNSNIFGRIGYRGYTVDDIVYEGSGSITLGPGNIVNQKLNLKSKTFLSWEKYHESPEIKIFNGDIIFVKTGSTIGKSCFIKNIDFEMTINPQIVVLKNIKINPEYLYYLSICPFFQYFFKTESVGGSTPTISQDKIKDFKILIPPNEEQVKIVKMVNQEIEIIEIIENKLIEKLHILKEYRQSLISSVVTGKIRITEDMI